MSLQSHAVAGKFHLELRIDGAREIYIGASSYSVAPAESGDAAFKQRVGVLRIDLQCFVTIGNGVVQSIQPEIDKTARAQRNRTLALEVQSFLAIRQGRIQLLPQCRASPTAIDE